MIALNSGDKLRADASVADRIDYTVHGVTGDVVTQLADGQFAAAEADIFTTASDGTIVTTIICVNTHNAAITCNIYLKPSGGISRRIIPVDVILAAGENMIFDGAKILVGITNKVVLDTGSAVIGKLAANSGVDIGDVDITSQPADTFAAEGEALGKGVLLQGDDGTDRHNVAVGVSGKVLVVEQEAANIETHLDHIEARFQADGEAIDYGLLVQGDDGTDRHNLEMAVNGDLKITLDSEPVVLGTGSAVIGKLAANSGVDIGDVDITSQPADTFAAEGEALGKGVLLQGDDGTDRHNVAVDAAGHLQIDVVGALPAGNAKVGVVDVDMLQGTWTCISVNINTATTTELKAAVAGHTYTVVTVSFTVAAGNNLTWKSAANAISGPMDFGQTGEPKGWQANLWPCGLKCIVGEALNLTTSTTGQVSGFICVLDES